MKKLKQFVPKTFQFFNFSAFQLTKCKAFYRCLSRYTSIPPYIHTYKIAKQFSSGQSSIEFVLFILLVTCVSFGMLKIFAVFWKHKFEFLSLSREILNALF